MNQQMTIDYKVFQYIRGAFRGLYGVEDLTDRHIAVRGMEEGGAGLLRRLQPTQAKLLFYPTSMSDYSRAFSICPDIEESPTIQYCFSTLFVDFIDKVIFIRKTFRYLEDIGEDPYNQGIHDFYI